MATVTPTERPTSVRYLVLLMIALAMACAYLTRIMAAVNTTIAEEMGYNDTQMGEILAGFSIGYLWLQVPAGWLGSHFGTRIILPMMALFWSLFTVAVSQAQSESGLFWSRLGIGLAQGGLIPCSAQVLAEWFPTQRRGLASALAAGSMQVGALLASGLTAFLLTFATWRTIYFCYSSVGVLWAIAFYFLFRNRPDQHPWTNQAERDLIRSDRPASSPQSSSGGMTMLLSVMVLSVSAWAMCGQAFARAFGYGFFSYWFPPYLEKARGLLKEEAGLTNMVPLLAFAIGGLVGGWITDALLVRTGSKRISRSGTASVALGLCALCYLAASVIENSSIVVVVISCSTFLSGVAGPPTWAAIMDMTRRHTAVYAGIMNTAGNIGDALCAWRLGILFTWIQATNADWNIVLYVFVVNYVFGAICWMFLDPSQSLDGDEPVEAKPGAVRAS